MGQQQLLLIVLGVIIVGVAVVAGIAMFNAGAEESAKDELVSQSVAIGANAQQYYKKPIAMGGGGNSFVGYTIPPKMTTTANGTYVATPTATTTTIQATPTQYTTFSVTCTVTKDSVKTVVNKL